MVAGTPFHLKIAGGAEVDSTPGLQLRRGQGTSVPERLWAAMRGICVHLIYSSVLYLPGAGAKVRMENVEWTNPRASLFPI